MGVNFCPKCEVSFNDDASMYCNCHPMFLCSVGHPNLLLANRVVHAPTPTAALWAFVENSWERGVLERGRPVGEQQKVYVIAAAAGDDCLHKAIVYDFDSSFVPVTNYSLRMSVLPGALENWGYAAHYQALRG